MTNATQLRPRWLPVYLFYLLAAILITWPLVTQLDTHLAGFESTDSTERAHHVWWLVHALRTGQTLFWLPNLGWPEGMLGVSLLAWPLQIIPTALPALVLPLLVADNLMFLLQMALPGLGMYALGLRLGGGSRAAALVGGLVFMAAPSLQAHFGAGHNGHHALAFAPLLVLALCRLRETTGGLQRRWFLAATLCFLLIAGGNSLHTVYVTLPLVTLIALRRLWQRDRRGLAQVLRVCLAGVLLQLLLVLPVVDTVFGNPVYAAAGGDLRYSLDLLAIVAPSPSHPLYAALGYNQLVLDKSIQEVSAWVGLVAGALAALALLRGRGRFWLALALLTWLLALGPLLKVLGEPLVLQLEGHASYLPLPWAFLRELPLLGIARTPGRFAYGLALAVACLATQGAALLLAQPRFRRRQALLLPLLLAAILFDYQWFWPFPTKEAAIPPQIAELRGRDDLRAVLNVPSRHVDASKDGLWLQTAHQLPLVDGMITRRTPVNPARLELLEATLDPALLRLAEADLVIIHLCCAPTRQQQLAATKLGPPLYQDERYVVYETPVTEAEPVLQLSPGPAPRFTTELNVPLYALQDGRLEVSANMQPGGRDLQLLLDNVPVQRWSYGQGETKRAVLPLRAESWHMLTLVPEPACPRPPSPALVCREEALEQFTLQRLPPDD